MNVDNLKLFPKESSVMSDSGFFNECCGISRGLIKGNIFNIPMDYGFDYATDFRLQDKQPTTGGEDPVIGVQADCIYGSLPIANSPQWAGNVQLDMNFNDYSPNQVLLARKYLMPGIQYLNGYSSIENYINQTGWGVMLAYKFYESFLSPNPDGSLPAPEGSFSLHCSPIFITGDQRGLGLNPLLGQEFGDRGYVYMPKSSLDSVSVFQLAYQKGGNAFYNRAIIGLQHLTALPDVIPVLTL